MITVFDVGARYGVHPRFISLFNSSSLNYFAFEVDSQEVSRLKSKYKSQRNYSIHNIGFGDKEEELEFNVLQHKGQSSFLKPNLDSLWFGKIRTQDSFIGDSKRYNLTTMDSFCAKNSLVPDFLKIDTEGYDLKVLIGGGRTLESVIAVVCEVFFEEIFVGAPLFPEIYSYLNEHNFILANMEYSGKGSPVSYFCPNPDRFGVITGCEATFVKKSDSDNMQSILSQLKMIVFCFHNHLEDLGYHYLANLDLTKRHLLQPEMWMEIKKGFARSVKKLSYLPGNSFDLAKADYIKFFDENYPDGHLFYQSSWLH